MGKFEEAMFVMLINFILLAIGLITGIVIWIFFGFLAAFKYVVVPLIILMIIFDGYTMRIPSADPEDYNRH